MRRREFLGLFGGLSATIISGAARGDAIKAAQCYTPVPCFARHCGLSS
jgi:hypothetical protein